MHAAFSFSSRLRQLESRINLTAAYENYFQVGIYLAPDDFRPRRGTRRRDSAAGGAELLIAPAALTAWATACGRSSILC